MQPNKDMVHQMLLESGRRSNTPPPAMNKLDIMNRELEDTSPNDTKRVTEIFEK